MTSDSNKYKLRKSKSGSTIILRLSSIDQSIDLRYPTQRDHQRIKIPLEFKLHLKAWVKLSDITVLLIRRLLQCLESLLLAAKTWTILEAPLWVLNPGRMIMTQRPNLNNRLCIKDLAHIMTPHVYRSIRLVRQNSWKTLMMLYLRTGKVVSAN